MKLNKKHIARQLAKDRLYQIAKGEDPLELRKKVSHQSSVKQLCEMYLERYLERYAKPHKRSWKNDERRNLKYLIPPWGNLKAES